MVVDVVGLKLEHAQKMLEAKGISWDFEITKAPRVQVSEDHSYPKRVVRQKKISAIKYFLTVVYQGSEEGSIIGCIDACPESAIVDSNKTP